MKRKRNKAPCLAKRWIVLNVKYLVSECARLCHRVLSRLKILICPAIFFYFVFADTARLRSDNPLSYIDSISFILASCFSSSHFRFLLFRSSLIPHFIPPSPRFFSSSCSLFISYFPFLSFFNFFLIPSVRPFYTFSSFSLLSFHFPLLPLNISFCLSSRFLIVFHFLLWSLVAEAKVDPWKSSLTHCRTCFFIDSLMLQFLYSNKSQPPLDLSWDI